ncbi:MAG: hypothetical protein HFJ35_02190 [Clostridia bacterium]|nr:hypothetical protein [Clostridia bacterium]
MKKIFFTALAIFLWILGILHVAKGISSPSPIAILGFIAIGFTIIALGHILMAKAWIQGKRW